MKLKDLLTTETYNQYGDMDVVDDVVDEMYSAWCGNAFTAEGYEHFAEALDIEAEVRTVWGAPTIYCLIDGNGWKRKRALLADLFDSMCGYCTEEEYDKWFMDPWDDGFAYYGGIPQGSSDEEDSLPRIEQLEYLLGNALSWVADHCSTADDYRRALEHLGYSGRPLRDMVDEYMA